MSCYCIHNKHLLENLVKTACFTKYLLVDLKLTFKFSISLDSVNISLVPHTLMASASFNFSSNLYGEREKNWVSDYFHMLKGQVRRLSLLFACIYVARLPNCCRDMKDDVDLFDQKGSFVCFNTQTGHLTITADSNDFVTEFGMVSFYVVKQLKIYEENMMKHFWRLLLFGWETLQFQMVSLVSKPILDWLKCRSILANDLQWLTGSSNIFPSLVCISSFFLLLMRM